MRTPSDASPQPYARGPVAGASFGLLLLLSPVVFGTHGFLVLFSLAGMIIVVGGVIATAFMSFPADDVRTALLAISAMLRQPLADQSGLRLDMNDIIHLARQIRPNGLSGMRAGLDAKTIRYKFVNYGLNMVLSEYRPDDVRAMMETAAEASYDRDCVPVDVLRAMTSHAPAFGMVGTLIGMIIMLCELDNNIAGMGSALSVAFLATLYGVVSARMVYMPAAARLQQQVDDRQRRHLLITEGMVMLAQGDTPSHIQDRLNGFLRPEQHDYFDVTANPSETSFMPMKPAVRGIGETRARTRVPVLLGAAGS
jgi:chemotaxis protein MotA